MNIILPMFLKRIFTLLTSVRGRFLSISHVMVILRKMKDKKVQKQTGKLALQNV